MDTLFEFDDVGLQVDDHVILDHVDLQVPAGRLVALVGPSGSGKSSLLRLCNRLDVATSGTVRFRGTPLERIDPLVVRRTVGMVFQRPTPFAGTVADNLRVADPTLDDAGAAAWCTRVGLDPALAHQDAATLSGGEAQRMCIARSLATGPEVLLMDEPTSALDDVSRDAVEALARSLVDDGLSVLWVSHDRDQVARLAEVVVRVEAGRVTSVETLR